MVFSKLLEDIVEALGVIEMGQRDHCLPRSMKMGIAVPRGGSAALRGRDL